MSEKTQKTELDTPSLKTRYDLIFVEADLNALVKTKRENVLISGKRWVTRRIYRDQRTGKEYIFALDCLCEVAEAAEAVNVCEAKITGSVHCDTPSREWVVNLPACAEAAEAQEAAELAEEVE